MMPGIAKITILEHDKAMHKLQTAIRWTQAAFMLSGILNIYLLAKGGIHGNL